MKRSAGRYFAMLGLCALVAGVTTASAQTPAPLRRRPPRPKPPILTRPMPPLRAPEANIQTGSLRSRLGVDAASGWLRSENELERQRAFERLSSVGTTQALDVLVKALEPGGPARTARDRVVLVRALSKHAKVAAVRELLVRIVSGLGASERADPLDAIAQGAAALALAKSGEAQAISALGNALRKPARIAEHARIALLAYPPENLAPLLELRAGPTRQLAQVLGELSDQRARAVLREFIKRGTPEVRAEASVALAKLGALDAVELARHWLATEKQSTLLVAATRVLLLAHTQDAEAALATLLKRPETQSTALELALNVNAESLAPELAKLLDTASERDAARILAVLGRASGKLASERLGRELLGPRADLSAHALALAPGQYAEQELEKALANDKTRRWAARAAVVRRFALRRELKNLHDALKILRGSPNVADRAAAAFCDAVLDEDRARSLLASNDPVLVRAAARAVLVFDLAAEAADALLRTRDAATRNALAIALADRKAASRVPTHVLRALLEMGDAAAAIAAFELAVRDSENDRARLEELLASEDPLIRRSVALGLGESRESSAVGLLANAYRFEANADVRAAIVHALSQRKESAKRRVLSLAAELDPDNQVRDAARLALFGTRLSSLTRGTGSIWLSLPGSSGASQNPPSAAIILNSGLALPAIADPDGSLILCGLDVSRFTLRLAAGRESDKASGQKL